MIKGMTWLQEQALRKPVEKMPEVAEASVASPKLEGESRQAKWKRLNPERVREAQKLLMRQRRARES